MIISLAPTDDFDAALQFSKPGDVLELDSAARYTTRGNWAHPSWGYGYNSRTIRCRQGAVSLAERPTLALSDAFMAPGGVYRPALDVNILWLGAGCTIADINFDCSLPASPSFRTGGLRFAGTYDLRRCGITGLRGSWAAKIEVFAVSSQGDTSGSIVEQVRVYSVTPNSYVSGIFLGGTVPATSHARVLNCDVNLGGDNMFCYSANYDTRFSRCAGTGAQAWFHNDTGPTRNAVIEDCAGSASAAAFRLISVDGAIRELTAIRCNISSPKGVVLWQASGGVMEGSVVVRDSNMPGEYVVTAVAPRASTTFINCNFSPGAKVYYLTSGPKPAIFQRDGVVTGLEYVPTAS
jgi:hypothetical protein